MTKRAGFFAFVRYRGAFSMAAQPDSRALGQAHHHALAFGRIDRHCRYMPQGDTEDRGTAVEDGCKLRRCRLLPRAPSAGAALVPRKKGATRSSAGLTVAGGLGGGCGAKKIDAEWPVGPCSHGTRCIDDSRRRQIGGANEAEGTGAAYGAKRCVNTVLTVKIASLPTRGRPICARERPRRHRSPERG
jgi:hypothetical protein